MAWEERRNGRRFFYLCKRTPDGRIHKQYFGKGLRAELESLRLELKACQTQQDLQLREVLAELDSLAEAYADSTRLLIEAHLYAAGYHNPKSRGWRKRRSGQMIKLTECENQEREHADLESGKLVTEEVTLDEVICRCRNGDRNALVTLRRVMQDHPDLFTRHGHIATKVQAEWIRAISGPDLFEREVMPKSTRELRQELIEEGTGSNLERLIIEQAVATHLEQGFHQLLEARCIGKGNELPKYQFNASQRASRRHEKVLAALTTIRTLAPQIEPASKPMVGEAADEKLQKQNERRSSPRNNRLTAVFDRTLQPVPMN